MLKFLPKLSQLCYPKVHTIKTILITKFCYSFDFLAMSIKPVRCTKMNKLPISESVCGWGWGSSSRVAMQSTM